AGKIVWKINDDITMAKASNRSSFKPKIFVELWHDPMITAAGGTFIDDIISICGTVNIGKKAGNGYPSYSIESLIAEDPDYIIVAGKSSEDIKRIRSDKRLANLKAVKENKILLIDSDIITRPTPRLITALNLINTFIRKTE
ncbi:MAG: ABC transporter substrate-binding protein, partial [Candidatus Margulisiibacteriota bacterium]